MWRMRERKTKMGSGIRRQRIEPTDEWKQLKLLRRWTEQSAYEEIRPLVLFDLPVAECAEETGASERALYRRINRFDEEGYGRSFLAESVKRRALSPAVRRLIVDLKAEHPTRA